MGFAKEVVVDGKAHMLGRLATVTAKQLLMGQKMTIVRCEEMNISGSLFRNRLKYMEFLRKKSNTNPRKCSHIHYKAPSKIFWRTVRGMLPHKTARGANALRNLTVVEGVPPTLQQKRKFVVNSALKHLSLRPDRAFCRLGDLSSSVGWKHDELVKRLEKNRKDEIATKRAAAGKK